MYLGEVTRNVLLSLIDAAPPILFNGFSTPILNCHYGFDTAYMSDIEAAQSLEDVRKVLVEKVGFAVGDVSDRDAEIVRWTCRVVATRAAKLSACAVAAVLVQTERATLGGGKSSDDERFSVGVDGRCVSCEYTYGNVLIVPTVSFNSILTSNLGSGNRYEHWLEKMSKRGWRSAWQKMEAVWEVSYAGCGLTYREMY